MEPKSPEEATDVWLEAEVEAAVAPYVGVLPEEELGWMRERLRETLQSDAEAASLAHAARPRHVDQSGTVVCDPISVDDTPDKTA